MILAARRVIRYAALVTLVTSAGISAIPSYTQHVIETEASTFELVSQVCAIGITEGVLACVTDSCMFPFNWLALSSLRCNIIKQIIKDYQKHGQKIDAEFLYENTWLVSWITYCMANNI
jgi:hypothetical protein